MNGLVSFFVSLFSFLLVIGICVIIHEGGHYLAAIWRGVQVHEFSFGMGPGIITKRRPSGTLWSWRAFPIGGYVRLEGEEEEPRPGDVPDRARAITAKRPWERFVIISGGAVMNIILAWFLTVVLLCANGVTDLESPVIGRVMPGHAAAAMGAEPGDRVLSINGRGITEWSQIRETLQAIGTDEVSIVIRRGENEITLAGNVPYDADRKVRLWGVQPSSIKYPFYKAAFVGMGYCWRMSVDILKGLWQMLTRQIQADVAGPVGIAAMAGDAARQGVWTFVTFLAVINLNLGLLNLLPFPALDGGRLVFILTEIIFRRKFPEKWENRIHLIGFAMLLTLIALVTFHDLARVFFDK
jgi:regulator of sigma E protease